MFSLVPKWKDLSLLREKQSYLLWLVSEMVFFNRSDLTRIKSTNYIRTNYSIRKRKELNSENCFCHLNATSEVKWRDVSDISDEEGHRLAALEEGQRVVHYDRSGMDDRKFVESDQNFLWCVILWTEKKYFSGFRLFELSSKLGLCNFNGRK